MSYTVKPSNQELSRVKSLIDRAVKTYKHSVDVEDFEFLLSWQSFDRDATVVDVDGEEIVFAVNSNTSEIDYESVEESVLIGLLELEFLQKTEYSIEFKWQEVLKFAYTKMRRAELTDSEPQTDEELEEYWNSILEQLSEDVSEFNEFFYTNTGLIGEAFASELAKIYEPEKVLDLKMSDVKKAGEKVFN